MIRLIGWVVFLLAVEAYGQPVAAPAGVRVPDLNINSRSGFFFQTDKSLYKSGERIWFSAYAFDFRDTTQKMHSVHVVLVNDMSQSVVSEQRFVLDRSIGYGSVYVPDSIQTGNYSLIAYSNLFTEKPKEHSYYRQPLEIIGTEPPFRISFTGGKTGEAGDLSINATIKKKDGSWAPKAELIYTIYVAGKEWASNRLIANNYGEALFTIPRSAALRNPEITAVIKLGKEKAMYKMPLQWQSDYNLVSLVPENKSLFDGQRGKIYFHLTSTSGKGLSERLELLEDDHVIDSADSDLYGIGVIAFTPKKGKQYRVNIKNSSVALVQQFPEIVEGGYQMQVLKYDWQKDSLALLITGPVNGQPFTVSLFNNTALFDQLTLIQKSGKAVLNLSTRGWPKGLCQIAVHDEGGNLKFKKNINLLPDTGSYRLTAVTDADVYRTRTRVKVTINVKDKTGKPLQSLLSLSAVQVYKSGEWNSDIKKFYYFDRFIQGRYAAPALNYMNGPHGLAYFLSWYGLNEADLKTDDTWMNNYQPAAFDGWVTSWRGKKVNDPVTLSVKADKNRQFRSNEDGSFRLQPDWLKANMQQKLQLHVSELNPEDYRIVMDSTNKLLNRKLAAQYYCLPFFIRKDDADIALKEEMQRSRNNVLEEVVVVAQKKQTGFMQSLFVSQTCMDWVCMNGVLNCSNHPGSYPGSKLAVSGERYGGRLYICECAERQVDYIRPLAPINYGDDFSLIDFSDTNTAIAREMLERTTLFWEPALITDKNGNAEVSFYTNDVTGRFELVIQGITGTGVVQGKTSFIVKDEKK